jgi:hypothetical protein
MPTLTVPSAIVDAQPASSLQEPVQRFKPWTRWERFSFRAGLIFVVELIGPIRLQFYQHFGQIHGLRDIYVLPAGGVTWLSPAGESGRWGIGSFVNWGIALLVSLVLASVWSWLVRNSARKEYTVVDYWLRLFVRYWVAITILGYGYIKVYPAQMPYPSLSNLHTLIGETAPYRYYWAIVGLSTWYEVVLGTIEVIAGSLFFFRRTTPLGALLSLGVMGNVAYANFAYDGGVHTLSAEITLFSAYLLAPYVRDLFRLLIKKEDVVPEDYHPVFSAAWKNRAFTGLKYAAWFALIPLNLYSTIHQFRHTNRSKEPRAPGLTAAKGYYAVTQFALDGKDLPYSPLDPVRWQDVVFEDYPTLTFKVNKPLPIRLENGGSHFKDAEKTYELAGFAGGRTYLHYTLDETNQTLTVQDKNATPDNDGGEFRGRPGILDPLLKKTAANEGKGHNQQISVARGRRGKTAKHPIQKLVWHYTRPSPTEITLSGQTFDGHAFYAVLDRVEDTQAIHVSSPVAGEPLVYGRQFGRRYPATPASFDGTQDGSAGTMTGVAKTQDDGKN